MTATDEFSEYILGLDSPAGNAERIDPDDNNDLSQVTRGLLVGVGGNVKVLMVDAVDPITIVNVPNGYILPIRVTRVYQTDTTASSIVAVGGRNPHSSGVYPDSDAIITQQFAGTILQAAAASVIQFAGAVVQTGPDTSQAVEAAVIQFAGAVAQTALDNEQAAEASVVQFAGAVAQSGPSPTQAAAGSVVSGEAPGGISAGLIFYQKGETASPATYLYEDDDSAAEFNDGVKRLANANNPGTNDLTQATAGNRPVYAENISGNYEGLDFTPGTPSDYLSSSAAAFQVERTSTFYMFAVVDFDDVSTYQFFLGNQQNAPDYRGISLFLTSSGQVAAQICSAYPANCIDLRETASRSTNQPYLIELYYNGDSDADTTDLLIDGVEVTYYIYTNALTGTILSGTDWFVGARQGGLGLNGAMLSSGLYSPAPSAGDRATIRAALKTEFGIS